MNLIFDEFKSDLQRLSKLITLINIIHEFPSTNRPEVYQAATSEFEFATNSLYEATKDCHSDTVILNGTLLLYLAGRFENFVKEILEDTCETLATVCSKYSNLPKAMQENLIKYTAEVIANPRKYGHAENGVKSFIRILNENLNNEPITSVNSKCLSITLENMWPDTLKDIFARIGIKNIWDKIGQQACVQLFFETDDPRNAEAEAKRTLKEFMETRNKIAHPSASISWPDSSKLKYFLDFSLTLAQALADSASVYARTLINRTETE